MEHKEYSGWTNYETWCCRLWLDNEEGSYLDMTEAARGYADDEDSDKETQDLAMSDYVKSYVDQLAEAFPQSGMFADFMNASLQEINYDEIAENYMNEARES